MTRPPLTMRQATIADAPDLAALWAELVRRPAPASAIDLQGVITAASASEDDRIVVAECDGQFAGAVFLRAAPLSPLLPEPVVQVISPHVVPAHRRHGVGRALMEAAVTFADERGIGYLASASASSSREAHRFLARLALAPQAVLRIAPTHVVRAKLSAQRADTSTRHLGQVLAARRGQRRRRERDGEPALR